MFFSDYEKIILFWSSIAILLIVCWAWDHTHGHKKPAARKKNRYVLAHTVLYFRNGSQKEIFSFLFLKCNLF